MRALSPPLPIATPQLTRRVFALPPPALPTGDLHDAAHDRRAAYPGARTRAAPDSYEPAARVRCRRREPRPPRQCERSRDRLDRRGDGRGRRQRRRRRAQGHQHRGYGRRWQEEDLRARWRHGRYEQDLGCGSIDG